MATAFVILIRQAPVLMVTPAAGHVCDKEPGISDRCVRSHAHSYLVAVALTSRAKARC